MANFILRKVDDALWQQFRERAQREGHSLRWVLVQLVEYYIKHGLR
jgi:plasmid stability protein